MTYRPDAEATELAWGNAQRNGARQTRPLVRNVAEMRRRQAEYEDPFNLDDDRLGLPSFGSRPVLPLPSLRSMPMLQGPIVDPAAFSALADRLAAAFAPVAETIRTLYEQLERFADSLGFASVQAMVDGLGADPTRAERIRHGRAAVCPRYGPTRGGMCRRCAR